MRLNTKLRKFRKLGDMEVAKNVLEVGLQFFLFGGGVAKQFLGMAGRNFFGSRVAKMSSH